MTEIIREAPVGQVIRLLSGNRWLKYPEEEPGFVWSMLDNPIPEKGVDAATAQNTTSPLPSTVDEEKIDENGSDDDVKEEQPDNEPNMAIQDRHSADLAQSLTRTTSRAYTIERFQTEAQIEVHKTKSIAIAPTKTADGTILVDWYTTDDPANPQNWSSGKKAWVLVILAFYSCAVYGASSMYVPGQEGVMQRFGVGHTAAALGLAIYVAGYGLGPLLFAPMSEIALFGRNSVYATTFFLFVILSIPTAVVDNYAGLLVLRFLTGFFGSPCLANGGATIGDMYSMLTLPMYLASWTAACFWGPAIGPLVAGFAVQAKGWRWGLWEIVWFTAPILVVFFIFFPETSAANILGRRAQRLRKLTGRPEIKSRSEIDQSNLRFSTVFWDAVIKPIEIMVKDPALLYTNVYTSLTYGIYYSFFEVFPLVYFPIYHFNLGELGLSFIVIGIGCLVGVAIFLTYQIYYLIPDIKKHGLRAPEHRLVPALFAVIALPAGYFMFGWTARPSVHWIAGLIGVTILVAANFIIFQCLFVYLPLSYPRYAASLFAGNAFVRSAFATACVLFARPMFIALGIGGGVSLLAGAACVGVFGMFFLWRFGAGLRARSTFAG